MIQELGISLTRFAVQKPKLVIRGMLVLTLALLAGAGLPTLFPNALGFLPSITIDTDPENMLPADDAVRVFHNQNKQAFNLHDAVVVGVVNEVHTAGVFNVQTLGKVHRLTEFAKGLDGVIAIDIMAPSTVDHMSHAGPGTVVFDWLMPRAPESEAEALAVRERAMRIPFLKNTLISADGKALVLYVPIVSKDIAHEVSGALREEIARIGADKDQFHIAGLPVAEDTFGIEMFIQMAISAPMAMVIIFLLMWFFFRRVIVIASPMYVAMASALCTMGVLVLTGNTVHIMSSMIPIFIMPIAVLDSVHIISDFFDIYPRVGDKRKAIDEVMGHLFSPMLFTSLTTAAGFASLALTPIPPVQVFGIFVAIGVLAAWGFTILFIPAYLMSLSEAQLAGFGRKADSAKQHKSVLSVLGRMRGPHAAVILLVAMGLIAVAVIGIGKINVNDNPTKWFEEEHEIRVADTVLNKHFGGVYDAYLKLEYQQPAYSAPIFAAAIADRAKAQGATVIEIFDQLQTTMHKYKNSDAGDAVDALDAMVRTRRVTASQPTQGVAWAHAGEFLNGLFERIESQSEPDDTVVFTAQYAKEAVAYAQTISESYATLAVLSRTIAAQNPADEAAFGALLIAKVQPQHKAIVQGFWNRQEQANEVFKDPQVLRYIAQLQAALATESAVGKSNSLADIVQVVHRDLISGEEKDYRIPTTAEAVGQTLAQYQSSHRKDDLWHFVTDDFQSAIVWFQLRSGDNMDMQHVVAAVERFVAANPPPVQLQTPRWFGLTYINVVWQDKMVSGMVDALLGSFVIVLIMMILLFRSVLWGILSMIPLTLTVALIYGILGIVGKDYDMPVAVLSSLSLGLAVDYAIHFLAQARQLQRKHGDWNTAQAAVFEEPARAIARNVVVVGFGFLPLLLAPLVPYQTVGMLIAAILIAAGLATLLLLPALIRILQSLLFGRGSENTKE